MNFLQLSLLLLFTAASQQSMCSETLELNHESNELSTALALLCNDSELQQLVYTYAPTPFSALEEQQSPVIVALNENHQAKVAKSIGSERTYFHRATNLLSSPLLILTLSIAGVTLLGEQKQVTTQRKSSSKKRNRASSQKKRLLKEGKRLLLQSYLSKKQPSLRH